MIHHNTSLIAEVIEQFAAEHLGKHKNNNPESKFTGYAQKIAENEKSTINSKKLSANDNYNINIYNNDNDSNDGDLTAEYIAKSFYDKENIVFYVHAFSNYPKTIIKKALRQVNNISAHKIKRSMGAPFNYLMKKFNEKSYEK